MRINNNIMALNAHRQLGVNQQAGARSMERLSSGLRINRAGDDAAGLAISEKMRGQIRGLNQATRNAQDGISLIQTAEGALNETHSIMQRMRELAVQAANDTLTIGDRVEIQKEVDQLTAEVDRIANTTEFNTKKLLDGTTSALVSTDKLSTKVFMRDGLRVMDQFGQKAPGGGNYKLDITAEAGVAQVQKTDIMKAKHAGETTGTGEVAMTQVGGEGGTGAQAVGSESLTDADIAALTDALELTFQIDGGDVQTMSITAGEMAAINTVDAFVDAINDGTGVAGWEGLQGATASISSPLVVTSDTAGPNSSVVMGGSGLSSVMGGPVVSATTTTNLPATGEVGSVTVVTESVSEAVGEITVTDTDPEVEGVAAMWDTGTLGGLPAESADGTSEFVFQGVTITLDYVDSGTTGETSVGAASENAITVTFNTGDGAPTAQQIAEAIIEGAQAYQASDVENTDALDGFVFELRDGDDGILITAPEAGATTEAITATNLDLGITGADQYDAGEGQGRAGVTEQERVIFEITEALGEGDTFTAGGITFTALAADNSTDGWIDLGTFTTAEQQAGRIQAILDGDGDLSASADGTEITLTQTAAGTGTIEESITIGNAGDTEGVYSFTITENLVDGESITIGSVTLVAGADADFEVGVDTDATAAAIKDAIQAEGTYTATVSESTIQVTESVASGVDLTDEDVSVLGQPAGQSVTSGLSFEDDAAVEAMTGTLEFTVTVGGVDNEITLNMSEIDTKDDLVAAINDQLTGATASFSSPLVITADDPDTTLSVGGTDVNALFGDPVEYIEATAGDNTIQDITVDATGGTFALTFNSTEKQQLDLGGATGGSYKLGVDGNMATLNYAATGEQIQTALEGIYGEGMVIVEDDVITFYDLGQASELQFDGSALVGAVDAGISTDIVTQQAGVEQIENIGNAKGVDYSGVTGDNPTFINPDGDVAGQIRFHNDNPDFDWADVNMGQDTTITIIRTADSLQVAIEATDGSGGIDVTDAYAMYDAATDTYRYDAHGLEFAISAEDWAAMNENDEVVIDLKAASGEDAAANFDLVGELGGSISTTNDWATNDQGGGDSSTAAFTGDAINLDFASLIPEAESFTIGLDAADGTLTVTIWDGQDGTGNALSTDAYDLAATADYEFSYDNHGISFELNLGDADELSFVRNFDFIAEETQSWAFASDTTGELAFDASAAEIQAALEGLSTIGAGNVEVDGNSWTVTFTNDLGEQRVNLLDINTDNLTGTVEIGDIARMDTRVKDIDRFWDASGNFLVDSPQTITLVQGNGARAAFTIFQDDTLGDLVDKMNAAIGDPVSNSPGIVEVGKGLGQGELVGEENRDNFVQYVDNPEDSGFGSVEGTFVIQSAISGRDGEISFIGDEEVIKALSLTTIQHSVENRFSVDIRDAHTGDDIATNVKTTGNLLVGAVHSNVDVEFDNMTNIKVEWNEDDAQWVHTGGNDADGDGVASSTFVHLADNTMVFHIGANSRQDVSAAIGDMRAAALGIDNVQVTSRDLANLAINQIDGAIERVSAERSKMGALQNRLEHTINNLGTSAENLQAAESRIRDLDMAAEMMQMTRNNILQQAATAMLAQANMAPQSVLQLLG